MQVRTMINGLGSRSVKEYVESTRLHFCDRRQYVQRPLSHRTPGHIVMRGALLEAHVSDTYIPTHFPRDLSSVTAIFDDIRPAGSAGNERGTKRSVPNEGDDVGRRKRILGIIVRMQTPVRWIA